MWQTKSPAQYAALRQLGVTAAKVQADRSGETAAGVAAKMTPLTGAGLGGYVENIATDFYSAYHRWTPDHPVNWKFLEAKRLLAEQPASTAAFLREPSLSDPAWLDRIRQRLQDSVRAYAQYRPLFFNLADEAGIADLTAAWDFDFSKPSLDGFRQWLRTQYPSLAALNREWGTGFTRWEEVVPETTTAAMQRTDGNYARWSDFKAWMDVAFARAIRAGAAAVHAGGSWARAGLEGVQIPGWGGYDYSRLAGTVDVMEMSADDVGLGIMRSLDPHLVILTTAFGSGPSDEHAEWQHLLRGARGLILWDERNDFVKDDSSLGTRGRAAAPLFAALRGARGAVLTKVRPRYDPIAILYSPASFRIEWMLDHRAAGSAWTQRGADTEDEDNAIRTATRDALHGLERLGFTPRFVTEQQIEQGILRRADYRLLVLPQVLALSPRAAERIRGFVEAGGWIAAAGEAGRFDDHGRKVATPLLKDLFRPDNRHAVMLPSASAAVRPALARIVAEAKLTPPVRLTAPSGEATSDIQPYLFRDGDVTILALQRDEPAEGSSDQARPVLVDLARAAYAYDVGEGRPLGRKTRLSLMVGPDAPAVIALADRPPSALMKGDIPP